MLAQIPDPLPEIYFGGSSPAAGDVAAKHADVYLTWGEPPEAVAREDRVDPQARRRRGPRGCRFGIRLHTIARDTAEEAWAEADRLLAGICPRSDRSGCRRACSAASPRASAGCSS